METSIYLQNEMPASCRFHKSNIYTAFHLTNTNNLKQQMKRQINTSNAPQAIGPYSQAISFDKILFISGQIPADPQTGEIVSGGVAEETHQVMKNLKAILEEAGSHFSNAVKTSIFLKNMDDFAVVNEIYASYFEEGNYPARETVQVAKLPKDVNVEISMIAHL